MRSRRAFAAGAAAATIAGLITVSLQADRSVRSSRRGTVVQGEEHTVAVGRRGAAVAGEEGAAAVGRRGAVAVDDEGHRARAGPHGAAVVGEEGAAAVGRYGGVVVGEHYESHEAWRTAAGVAAGVATGIAIGTMLSRPPTSSTTGVVGRTSYMYSGGVYYQRVSNGYRVVVLN